MLVITWIILEPIVNKLYIQDSDIKTYLQTILRAMHKDKFVPDVVVGLSRGGLQPAVMLSNYFDVPMIPVSLALRDHQVERLDFEIDPGKKYLVIDDINDHNKTSCRTLQDPLSWNNQRDDNADSN